MTEDELAILVVRMIGIRIGPSERIVEYRLCFLEADSVSGTVRFCLPVVPSKNA